MLLHRYMSAASIVDWLVLIIPGTFFSCFLARDPLSVVYLACSYLFTCPPSQVDLSTDVYVYVFS